MSDAASDSQTTNRANEREKSESLLGWITVLTTLFLICATTALFAAGQGYRQGYWYELGFDLAQIPSDFHETLFWGFAGGAPLFFSWLLAALIALPACGLLMWFAGASWTSAKNRWQPLRRISLPSATPGRPVSTHVKLIGSVFLFLPAIYLLGVAYFAMAEFQKAGTKRGKQFVEAFRTDAIAASAKHETQWIEIWLDSPADSVARGYRLLCTQSLCSIYDPDPKVRAVRLIALDNLREIRVVDKLRKP